MSDTTSTTTTGTLDPQLRIAASLETIATELGIISELMDEQLSELRTLNREFSMFSRHGFGV